jgi:hypothetical protein
MGSARSTGSDDCGDTRNVVDSGVRTDSACQHRECFYFVGWYCLRGLLAVPCSVTLNASRIAPSGVDVLRGMVFFSYLPNLIVSYSDPVINNIRTTNDLF